MILYLRWSVAVFLVVFSAEAHLASDSFLQLKIENDRAQLRWDLPVLNLEPILKVDTNADGNWSVDEAQKAETRIREFLANGVTLTNAGLVCATDYVGMKIDSRGAGNYAVVEEVLRCPNELKSIGIDYRLFFRADSQHKAFVSLERDGAVQTATLDERTPQTTLTFEPTSGFRRLMVFVVEGIWHIWIGFDHILFLLTLLLPAALIRRNQRWEAPESFRTVLSEVIKVVTSFTVAHSITLVLASLQIVELPARWVESAIALSVVLTALNNIFPVIESGRWRLAFLFGFIHGFGFASVLADLGLPRAHLALALLGFNVGVEIGQLAIVVAILPVIFSLRRTVFYRRFFLLGGSGATALLALLWFIERSADLKFLPF